MSAQAKLPLFIDPATGFRSSVRVLLEEEGEGGRGKQGWGEADGTTPTREERRGDSHRRAGAGRGEDVEG
eukprot:627048-Hanusia_phi.AAC.1